MEQIFFRALFALLNDKQVVKITTTRVGDKLTLLINKDNKLITMTGNPEEVDNGIINHLKVNTTPTEQEFSVTVQDAPEGEKPDDKKAASSGNKKVASKAKKPAAGAKKDASNAKPEKKKAGTKGTKETAKTEATEPDQEPDNSKEIEEAKEKLKEFTASMDSGNKCMKDADYANAIIHYEFAITIAPEGNTKAAQDLGKAKKAFNKQQLDAAEKKFKETMDIGLKQRADRQYEASLETFNKMKAEYPDNPEVIKQVGIAEKWVKALQEMEN